MSRASENISKYEHGVKISNSHLTAKWRGCIQHIERLVTNKSERLDATCEPSTAIRNLTETRKQIFSSISENSKTVQAIVSDEVKYIALQIIHEVFRAVDHDPTAPVAKLSSKAELLTDDHWSRILEVDQAEVASSVTRETQALLGNGISYRDCLLEAADSLIRTAKHHSFTVDVATIVSDARDDLAADVQQFFRNVEVYQSGVFTAEALQYVRILGLESHFDELRRTDFDTSKQRDCENEILDSMFGDFDQAVKELNSSVEVLAITVSKVKQGCPDFDLTSPDAVSHALKMEWKEYCEENRPGLSNRLKSSFSEVIGGIIKRASEKLETLQSDFEEANSNRRRAVVKTQVKRFSLCTITAIILALVFLSLRHLDFVPKWTLGESIAFEFATVTGFGGIGMLLAWIRNRTDKKPDETKSDLLAQYHKDVLAIEAEAAQSTQEAHGELARIADWLEAFWTTKTSLTLENPALTHHVTTIHDLQGQRAKLEEAKDEFKRQIRAFGRSCLSLFEDEEANLNRLESLSSRIRSSAIEPSHEILKKLNEELQGVSASMA